MREERREGFEKKGEIRLLRFRGEHERASREIEREQDRPVEIRGGMESTRSSTRYELRIFTRFARYCLQWILTRCYFPRTMKVGIFRLEGARFFRARNLDKEGETPMGKHPAVARAEKHPLGQEDLELVAAS